MRKDLKIWFSVVENLPESIPWLIGNEVLSNADILQSRTPPVLELNKNGVRKMIEIEKRNGLLMLPIL